MHTLHDFGVPLDAGATAIYSGNQYLVGFVQKFGLAKAADVAGEIGVWDGQAFRFRWPDGALLPARLLARYGISPAKVIPAVKDAVSKLEAIYDLQARNASYASPAEMFEALRLTEETQASAARPA